MSDQHAINHYFGPGGDTEFCSGSIETYPPGRMTAPAALRQIATEEGVYSEMEQRRNDSSSISNFPRR